MTKSVTFTLAMACLLPACGDGNQGAGGGFGADGGPDGKSATHAPANHRQTGSSCPQERGPGISEVGSACAQNPTVTTHCLQDSDCTGGTDGRCLAFGGPACSYGCTYDECSSDADCTSNVPCACRASDSDWTANTCATQSNCRIDTDCGPGGYCSPSMVGSVCQCASQAFCQPGEGGCYETAPDGTTTQVACFCTGNCGHGYFCHTPKDSCVDDGDCAPGMTCNYDLTSQSWMCSNDLCPL